MLKESDNREESSVSVLNFQNVDSNVCESESERKGENDECDSYQNVETEEQTSKEWVLPEGYTFLPEELFRTKDIPPPLVSLSWLSQLKGDEEPEDSIPLAKLKKIIRRRKKQGKSNQHKEKLKMKRKKPMENAVDRKRGRPKKQPVETFSSGNIDKGAEDTFWNSFSDSSSLDNEVGLDYQTDSVAEDNSTFNINYNEHDYFKPIENTAAEDGKVREGVEKQRKKKTAVQGVKIGDSKVSFPCFECGKSFSAASTLKSHQRIHNGTLLICPECHKGFVSKYLLKCHMRIHNGDLFMCHKCGRGFTTAELLKVHSRAHTGDRPFVCNICGKSFPTSSNMLQHKQIHNSEKKFLCSQCGSSFVQKRCLDYHMLTHSEKKNICNVCGKLWARKSDLIEHMRVHTGVKPYCCSLCPQKFSQASSLKRHQLVHLDAKPISCVTCKKMFKCQEYYKRHLRKHEKEECFFEHV